MSLLPKRILGIHKATKTVFPDKPPSAMGWTPAPGDGIHHACEANIEALEGNTIIYTLVLKSVAGGVRMIWSSRSCRWATSACGRSLPVA